MAEPPVSPPPPDDPTTRPAAELPAPTGKATAAPGIPPSEGGTFARMRLRRPPSTLARGLAAAACVVLIVIVWALITSGRAEDRLISPTVLPSPMETLRAFHSLWFEAALTRNLVASLWRVLQGFGLATLIGVPLGIIAGAWPKVNAFIAPISIFGRNVPIVALVPLTLVWFGIDELQKIMFIFVACVMFIVFDAARAVTSVHESYVQTALTLGARPLQILMKVLIPLALPEIFGSLRLLFGVAFGYIIIAEMVNAEYGLGHLILVAQRRGPLAHVYLVLFVITLVAFAIDRLLLAMQGWLFPYRQRT
jgi:ABC-type nitrate/sulfonate/bicarbonate transport system permease component